MLSHLIVIFKSSVFRFVWLATALFVFSHCQSKNSDERTRSTPISISGKLLEDTSLTQSYQSACLNSKVYLYKLDEQGSRVEPPLAQQELQSDKTYNFQIGNLDIRFKGQRPAEPLLISVNNCQSGKVYLRPLTGTTNQDLSAGSSLMTYLLNTSQKNSLLNLLSSNPENLDSIIKKIELTSDFESPFQQLETDLVTKELFVNTFQTAPNILNQASPEFQQLTIPSMANELENVEFSVTVTHWSSQYDKAYEWSIDNQFISHTATLTHQFHANSQGSRAIMIKIEKSDGQGQIDINYPYKTQQFNILVSNNALPITPSFHIISPNIQGLLPINTRNLEIEIQTGVDLINCASFSKLALTDNLNQAPDDALFNIECSQSHTQTITYNTISPGDGEKVLRLWAKDNSGSIAGTNQEIRFFLDTTAPTVTLTQTPASLSSSTNPSFGFTAIDSGSNIDYFECQIDQDNFSTCTSPIGYSNLNGGNHEFSVRARDTSGNISNSISFSFMIDTAPPQLSLTTTPLPLTSSTSSLFNFNATDSESGVSQINCRIDNSNFATCLSPMLLVLTGGTHTFDIQAIDNAGNFSNLISYTWVIDLIPPTLNLISSPNSITNQTQANFTFLASDSGGAEVANYLCAIDSAEFSNCSSSIDYSSLTPGLHQFQVRATDTVGNHSAITSYSWTIDTTPPSVTLLSNPPAVTNQTSVSFSFNGSDLGGGSVLSYECKINNGSFNLCTSPQVYSNLIDGLNIFKIKVTDTADNVSTESSYSWTIDTSPPQVNITQPAQNHTVVLNSELTNYTLSGNCSETNDVYLTGILTTSVSCNNGFWSKTLDLSSFNDGSITFSATQTDSAGNVAQSPVTTIIKDTLPPQINVITPSAIRGNTSNGTLQWTLSELNILSNSQFHIELFDGAQWINIGTINALAGVNSNQIYTFSNWTVPNLNLTNARFRITLSDAANNTTTTSSNTFTIDSLAPQITDGSFIAAGENQNISNNNIAIQFSASDNLLPISHFCLKYNETLVTPTQNDSCWIDVSIAGITPNLNISITQFYFRLSFASGTYRVKLWVRDSVNNISLLTQNISKDITQPINYIPNAPPTIDYFKASSTAAPQNPLSSSDLTAPLNSDIHLRWKANSTTGFATNSVRIFYTLNGTTWIGINELFNNNINGDCILIDQDTGCIKLTNGSPSSQFIQYRIEVADINYIIATSSALPLNSNSIRFIAGNTDPGTNGSAATSVFLSAPTIDGRIGDSQTLVVHPDGRIFVRDRNRGIMVIDPTNGLSQIFIPKTGVSSGDNGPVTAATLRAPALIALDFENNLLIWDHNIIRKVDLSAANPQITKLIGRGINSSDTADANNLSLPALTEGQGFKIQMLAGPDHKLYFRSTTSDYTDSNQIRIFNMKTNQLSTIRLTGFAFPDAPSLNLNLNTCAIDSFAPIFNSNNELIEFIAGYYTTPTNNGNPCSYNLTFSGFESFFNSNGSWNRFRNNNGAPLVGNLKRFTLGHDKQVYQMTAGYNQVYRLESNETYSLVLGSGTGRSPDGTNGVSAKITYEDFVVDQKSKFYVKESGSIRTLNDNGDLLTLAGQMLNFGDGGNSLNARFSIITSLQLWNDGLIDRMTLLDAKERTIREIQLDNQSLIQKVAGNSINQGIIFGSQAITSQIQTSNAFAVSDLIVTDPNGNIYISANQSIAKLNRQTGLWERFAGQGTIDFFSGDGQLATNIKYNVANSLTQIIGFGNNKILAPLVQLNINLYNKPHYKLFDVTSRLQSNLAGSLNDNVSQTSWCTDGTALNSCNIPSSTPSQMGAHFDSNSNAWLIGTINGSIKKLVPNGVLQNYYTSSGLQSFAFRRDGSDELIYTCNTPNRRITKINITTNTVTNLDWPIPNLLCQKGNMIYSSTRNSLIFIFEQNGLYGVAEYLNP